MLFGQKINAFLKLFLKLFLLLYLAAFVAFQETAMARQINLTETMQYPIFVLTPDFLEKICQYLISSWAEEFSLSVAEKDAGMASHVSSFQHFDHTIMFKVSFENFD